MCSSAWAAKGWGSRRESWEEVGSVLGFFACGEEDPVGGFRLEPLGGIVRLRGWTERDVGIFKGGRLWRIGLCSVRREIWRMFMQVQLPIWLLLGIGELGR